MLQKPMIIRNTQVSLSPPRTLANAEKIVLVNLYAYNRPLSITQHTAVYYLTYIIL